MADYNTSGYPVGVGYDAKGRAKVFVELSSLTLTSVSASEYLGLNLALSALSGYCSDAPAPADGQVLAWSSTNCWAPSTVALISDLSDAGDYCSEAPEPTVGQILTWSSTNCWAPSTVSAITAISGATDTDILEPQLDPGAFDVLPILAWDDSTRNWKGVKMALPSQNLSDGNYITESGGVSTIEFPKFFSRADNTGKGDLNTGFIYVSGTSSQETEIIGTDFARTFVHSDPGTLENQAQLLYFSGNTASSLSIASPSIYKTFPSISDNSSNQIVFVGPVEVSTTTPTAATGKVWLDNSPAAIGPSGLGKLAYTDITETYSALDSDNVIVADCTASSLSATLPKASSQGAGKVYTIKKIDNANDLYVVPTGADTIDGQTSIKYTTQYLSITYVSNGSTGYWMT